jgi:hypothetical protein
MKHAIGRREQANLFFQVVAQRYERGSMILMYRVNHFCFTATIIFVSRRQVKRSIPSDTSRAAAAIF